MKITTRPSTSITGFTLIGFLVAFCAIILISLLISSQTHTRGFSKIRQCMNNLDQHGKMMQSFHMNFGFYPPINGKSKNAQEANWALYIRHYQMNGTRWKEDEAYPAVLWYCPVLDEPPVDRDPTNGTYAWPNRPCPASYPDSISSGRNQFTKAFPDSAPIAADRLPTRGEYNGNHGAVTYPHNVLTWGKEVKKVTNEDDLWKETSCFAEAGPDDDQ